MGRVLTFFFILSAHIIEPIYADVHKTKSDVEIHDHAKILQAIHSSKIRLDAAANRFESLARSVAGSCLYKIYSNYLEKSLVARVQKGSFADSSALYHDVMIASQEGYSPKVYLADAALGIIVLEEIAHQWPSERYTSSFFEKINLPLRQMHQGRPFQRTKLFYEWLDDAEEKLKKNNIPIPTFHSDYFNQYEKIKLILKSNSSVFEKDIMPTHHDINPGNILFDQQKAYLIDFETASQDIFYLDLAEAFNFFIYDDSKIQSFLTVYFMKEPNEEQVSKFMLFKALAFLKNGLWLAHISGVTKLPDDKNILEYPLFEARIRKGLVDFSNPQELQNLAISEFNEGIRLLNDPQCQKAIAFLFSEKK
jgi:thiamine kinase-like enzyme